MLPLAVPVAGPFHVVKLAGTALNDVRRGCRTRPVGITVAATIRSGESGVDSQSRPSDSPSIPTNDWSACCALATRDKRSGWRGTLRKREGSGKEAGRKREGSGKEAVRQTYAHSDPELADQWVAEIIRNFADDTIPIEVRRLGRTTKKWAAQITAWHRPHVSNGPTEGVNDLGRAH
jgi:transposase